LKHAKPPGDTWYSSRIAPAAASAFFPSSKTRGNRRIAVLFSLLHFYRICLRIASMRKKGSTMKGFLVGLILGLLIVPIALFFYVETGQAPAAASDSPMPFEKFLARGALHARIKNETQERELSTFNAGDLGAGADVYRANCAFCHGLPLQAPSAASQGMFPHAPQLFTAKETVTDDPVGETYWKVKNGIRLTGMPGFQKALSDQQMWQVSALMASADKLPPDVLRSLLPATAPANATSAAPAATAVPTPATPLPTSP
jgi:thiosulfate dehydrogenase